MGVSKQIKDTMITAEKMKISVLKGRFQKLHIECHIKHWPKNLITLSIIAGPKYPFSVVKWNANPPTIDPSLLTKSHSVLVSHFNFYCYCNISVKKDEVENLLALFEANAKNEKMDRSKFRDILYKQFELTEDILMDRGK